MKRILLAAMLLAPIAARAQTPIIPSGTHGCGTMSITTGTAITASNVTLCNGSPSFPTSGGIVMLTVNIQANSQNMAVLCLFGLPCTTGGMVLAVGQGQGKSVPSLNVVNQPAAVAPVAGTATIYLEW